MYNFSFLQSRRIQLRPIEPEDLDLLYVIENSSFLWNSTNTTMPYSKFFLKKYLESTQGDIYADKQLRLVVEQRSDSKALGLIDLYDVVPLHQRAEVGIVILPAYRSKGYAKEAMALLLDYCFNHLMLHQLYSKVALNNTASISLFKSCGFKEVACLEDWLFTQDGFEDVYLFQKKNSSL